jgi:hypothetical protein
MSELAIMRSSIPARRIAGVKRVCQDSAARTLREHSGPMHVDTVSTYAGSSSVGTTKAVDDLQNA